MTKSVHGAKKIPQAKFYSYWLFTEADEYCKNTKIYIKLGDNRTLFNNLGKFTHNFGGRWDLGSLN